MHKIFALFFILMPSIVFSQDVDKKLHIDCIYPSVGISCPEFNSTGSGVIIRSEPIREDLYYNVVISCDHVFNIQGSTCYIVTGEYKDWSKIEAKYRYPCRLLHQDNNYDLAIITFLSNDKMPVAQINFNYNPYIGDDLVKISSGQCLQDIFRLDCGKLTATNVILGEVANKQPVYRTSIFTVPGDSGGPVYKDYKLIALICALGTYSTGEPTHNISFAIPIDFLKKMNSDINNQLEFIYNKEKPSLKLQYLLMRLDSSKVEKIKQ